MMKTEPVNCSCYHFEHVGQRNEGGWSPFALLEMQSIPLTDDRQVNTVMAPLRFNRKLTVKKKSRRDETTSSDMKLHRQLERIRLSRQ
jgi:hypothetical protein